MDDWTADEDDDEGAYFRSSVSAGTESGAVWIPATIPLDVVLFKSAQVAIWLSCFRATPERLTFELQARYRHDAPKTPNTPQANDDKAKLPALALDEATSSIEELDSLWSATYESSQTFDKPGQGLRVGMAFGERHAEYGEHRSGTSEGLTLWSDSGGSGGGHHHASLHCSMLPDADVTFWAQWPRLGVERSEVRVGTDVFKDAGDTAVQLWEVPNPFAEGWHPGEPPPPPPMGTW